MFSSLISLCFHLRVIGLWLMGWDRNMEEQRGMFLLVKRRCMYINNKVIRISDFTRIFKKDTAVFSSFFPWKPVVVSSQLNPSKIFQMIFCEVYPVRWKTVGNTWALMKSFQLIKMNSSLAKMWKAVPSLGLSWRSSSSSFKPCEWLLHYFCLFQKYLTSFWGMCSFLTSVAEIRDGYGPKKSCWLHRKKMNLKLEL